MNDRQLAGEVTELLQRLIRNRCVNDGTKESGQESRNVSTLVDYLDGSGLETQTFEDLPGRASLVTRMKGTDPSAPTLLLMGHTDVVPANDAGWTVDPFAGHFDGDRVWGRGAIDMLNLTASMAVAMKNLAMSGIRPRGDLVFFAVADEEAGGVHGAKYVLDNHAEALKTDFVITESGGFQLPSPAGPRLPITVGEKGDSFCTLTIKGVPGHASMPFQADNAIATAARVVQRLVDHQTVPVLGDVWHQFVQAMAFHAELTEALLDPLRFDEAIHRLPEGLTKRAHANARFTATPTVIKGGTKVNVIPDAVEVSVDVRTLVGQREADVRSYFAEVLGDLADRVEIRVPFSTEATVSPTANALWDAMTAVSRELVPGSACVPTTTAGGTDAYYFRRLGIPAYGFGLFSEQMTAKTFFEMFHGNDEWVDQESLLLSTKLWIGLAQAL